MDFDVFIKGKNIDLVVLTSEVVEKTNWYSWFNDENNTKNMQQHYFPNSKELQLKYLKDEIEGSNTKIQLGIVNNNNNLFLGVISLNNIDHLNRCCEFSSIIGEADGKNIKFFVEAAKLLIKHAFDTLNINRIYSGTISKEIDLLMRRTLGFEHEGRLKQAIYKNGAYHDIYQHALLNKNQNC
jgi:[ribosomal protein S5]-alanine N-acetyltransferase